MSRMLLAALLLLWCGCTGPTDTSNPADSGDNGEVVTPDDGDATGDDTADGDAADPTDDGADVDDGAGDDGGDVVDDGGADAGDDSGDDGVVDDGGTDAGDDAGDGTTDGTTGDSGDTSGGDTGGGDTGGGDTGEEDPVAVACQGLSAEEQTLFYDLVYIGIEQERPMDEIVATAVDGCPDDPAIDCEACILAIAAAYEAEQGE